MRKLYFVIFATLTIMMLPGLGIADFNDECLERGAMWSNVLVDYEITTGSTNPAYIVPENALGEITSWATPSYPAFGAGTLVSFNYVDDYVVVGFEDGAGNRVVTNNADNPGGYDFVVWGNAMAISGGGIYAEPGKVEVSQDGDSWFEMTDGWSNRFDVTPTNGAGIVYPDSDLTTYAGGDYFDIASIGLDWIGYIRLSDASGGGTADLDAIAALSTIESSAVPIPGAVWLIASAFITIVGIKRKVG